MTQLPAYLLKRQSRATTEDMISGIGSGLPPHLSIEGNRFTLVDASGNEKPAPTFHFDICIIGANANASMLFYDPAKKFAGKGGDNGPPLCWSDNGVGPSRQASTPQAPTCAVCPHAEWGAAISQMTGRGVPACKSGKKIAFIVPGDADDIVYMLRIPPASLKPWFKYVKTLGANSIGGRPAEAPDVITRLEFESQGVLKFNAVGLVDEDTFNRTEQVYATDAIAQVTGRDDIAIDPSRQLAAPVQTNASPPKEQNLGTYQTNALAGPAPQRMAPPAPLPDWQATQHVIPHAQAQQPQKAIGDDGIPDFLRNQGGATQPLPEAVKPPKATKKTKAAEALAKDGDITQSDNLAVPGFLRRTQEAKEPTASFGMVPDAPSPSNDVNEALAKAFALPGV